MSKRSKGKGASTAKSKTAAAVTGPVYVPRNKCTRTVRADICRLIAQGVSLEAAAVGSGVGASTFWRWCKLGRDALERATQDALNAAAVANDNAEPDALTFVQPSELPYVQLVAEIDHAFGQAEIAFSLNVHAGARDDWKAAAWWLERRRPQHYSSKSELRIEREPAVMSNEEMIAELNELGFVQVPVVQGAQVLSLSHGGGTSTESGDR